MDGEYQFAKDLRYDLRRPCADCPFLRTSKLHGGVAQSLQNYLESIEERRFAHSCHKTDNREACDGPRNHDGPPQHCLGSLMMLAKRGPKVPGVNNPSLQWPLLQALEDGRLSSERYREIVAEARSRKDVYTLSALLKAYLKWLQKEQGKADENAG